MRAVVCIPYRDSGEESRRDAFWYVSEWWRRLDLPVVVADSDKGEPFNIAQARNRAAEWAIAHYDSVEVLIFCDADTFPEWDRVLVAIYESRLVLGVIYPHDHYWSLDEQDTAYRVNHKPDVALPTEADPLCYVANRTSVSGVVVCTVDSWRAIGGWDERFSAWGSEDVAFAIMARDVLGRALRMSGNVWHLWHRRDGYPTTRNEAHDRLRAEYEAAALIGPHALRELRGLD